VAVDRRPNTKLTFGDVIRHSKTARRDRREVRSHIE
ncbi:hypothetical protein D043_1887B, partial [Vibrio parahaemolyticus EKP-021]